LKNYSLNLMKNTIDNNNREINFDMKFKDNHEFNDLSSKSNYPPYIEQTFTFKASPHQKPERIDVYLTRMVQNATRNKVQKALDEGCVTVNGITTKSSRKVKPNDEIICKILKPPPIELVPENISLEIVYEDESFLIVNKPAGMVTHPGYGNRYGTLVNALLWHFGYRDSIQIEDIEEEDENENIQYLEEIGYLKDEGKIFSSDAIRPGIVHRLDKDTSGLLVIAKKPGVHAKLAEQFDNRTIERFYYAIAWGKFENDKGIINENIGRSTKDRKLFSVVAKGGRRAITEYEVIERYEYAALLKIKLQTGRTHQIRVHFLHINRPIFGDPSYGGRNILYGGNNPNWKKKCDECLKIVSRQMLHARSIGFRHPVSNAWISFESDLPTDMKEVIKILNSEF
jgi:23S rRNA pseudouridine1911/1915/1917 synthase